MIGFIFHFSFFNVFFLGARDMSFSPSFDAIPSMLGKEHRD